MIIRSAISGSKVVGDIHGGVGGYCDMTQHKQYKSFVRRIVPLFLCVVMIANMLSGCGPSSLTMNITGWSKLFGFFKDKTDDNKVERTGSFSENLKEGWDYAEKYLSSQLSSQKGADYVKKVSDAIEKLQKDINYNFPNQ